MTLQTSQHPAPATEPVDRRAAGAVPEVPTWRRKLRPYLLSVPAVLIVVGILYPFAVGAYYAFLNYAAVNPDPHFVWFENFKSVLGDQIFWQSAKVTAIFAVLATVIETVIGVGLALLLNRSSLIGRMFEKVLILPLMIAPVIAGVIWKLMFNPQFGILNHVLGLGNTFDWLSSTNALWSVILVDLWIFTPFVAILVLAGIRSLPKEPFEASEVDGAGWFYMFRKLMLPMLWPYILVAVIFRFMDNLKVFDHIYVLTAGGPGVATRTLQIGAFEDSIINLDYSRGSTYMLLLWVIVFITARYLVSVLGKAQRRAAGAES
ncbi:carbohydrate ABC transporter membrane protein 1, CUT1 family [Mycolicibacterium rutilum]|uniref:Carbohydrate ABC transporter membrane protein 1, CUT1 family n=1 Tax=Mycolicibacterium rutilum TaxID=370526 RepID=A0A1H6KT01_MYCRU|nr:sugar ABC transporter permease [Mycolicibacterium rutilum]SEH76697.1 carbohydrate ABC transporter membrane protein 1, CUT1 family [Mycolicibacterium rutilum]